MKVAGSESGFSHYAISGYLRDWPTQNGGFESRCLHNELATGNRLSLGLKAYADYGGMETEMETRARYCGLNSALFSG